MKFKKTIKNVKSFIFDYCISSGDVVNISTEKSIKNIKNQVEIFTFGKNNLITRDIRGNSNVIDISKSTVNNTFKIDLIKYPYFTFYEFSSLDKEGVFDFLNQKIIYETKNCLGRYIIDNYIFTDDIICRNIHNGEILWQYEISSIEANPNNDLYNKDASWEVNKIIGIIADKLWLALNHHTIIAVDVHTGTLVHRLDHIADFTCSWLPSAIPLPEATVVDEKNNLLIGFMWEFYWEINPINGTLTFMDLTEELKQAAIRNDLASFILTDDSLYFASHPSESKIGLLDRQSKKVTWSYEFKTEEGEREVRIMQLQGNEDKIGALSSAKTLYLFEKE